MYPNFIRSKITKIPTELYLIIGNDGRCMSMVRFNGAKIRKRRKQARAQGTPLGCPGRPNRKIGIARKGTGRFVLFFDILCKIVYSIEWVKTISGHSHLAPYSAILTLFALGRQMGVPTYFFAHLFFRSFGRVDDFT